VPRMRVGFDARWYNDSGVGTYVAGLLAEFARRRLDFDLVIYEGARNPIPELDSNTFERIQLSSGRYALRSQWELKRRVVADRLDVFHSPFYWSSLLVSCPVVITIHDLIPMLFPIYSWPKRLLVNAGHRMAVKQSTEIIAVSAHTARDIEKILYAPSERIHVVHNAADRTFFHPEKQGSELETLAQKYGILPPFVVAGSARNWRTKNLPAALSALALARKKTGTEFQTVVYGPEEGLKAALAQDHPDDPNLVATGYLKAQELGMLFRHAHAFIMPSLYEGFGLPLLEAMSCGCAVVVSSGGSLAEIAGGGAQVFAADECEKMAEAIGRLLCHVQELCAWQQRALIRAAEFSWSRAAEQTISVYDRAVTRRRL
jgi:glycosyltransferase involved in cell wall biosynthesis